MVTDIYLYVNMGMNIVHKIDKSTLQIKLSYTIKEHLYKFLLCISIYGDAQGGFQD